jgi:hypothetical protein
MKIFKYFKLIECVYEDIEAARAIGGNGDE